MQGLLTHSRDCNACRQCLCDDAQLVRHLSRTTGHACTRDACTLSAAPSGFCQCLLFTVPRKGLCQRLLLTVPGKGLCQCVLLTVPLKGVCHCAVLTVPTKVLCQCVLLDCTEKRAAAFSTRCMSGSMLACRSSSSSSTDRLSSA